MLRFTSKDLFLATTLIAIGLAIFIFFGVRGPQPLPFAVTLFFALSVGPLIGGGLGVVLNKIKIGACLGLAVQLVVWFLLLYFGWIV